MANGSGEWARMRSMPPKTALGWLCVKERAKGPPSWSGSVFAGHRVVALLVPSLGWLDPHPAVCDNTER
ncbi:hypothetical protein J2Z21_008579 [Streptomyces griseochromogenes]|uniref:Uncharacterized protein n=1 Tax=Streptomyces griseochromogenes TaxID=68214 RepID=A0A1B1B3H7_9ACTN|nr:hypothetical protein [Streptomyces griseochromogenes]ANP53311.1 hypothetical protein AVL59_30640 [Streptomyces griseochromogenes]MBP2055563.1 hypothetical protein [Streptomyces griseochromogenes]